MAPAMYEVEGQNIPQDGEDETYNLESLFARVGHPGEQSTKLEAESPSGVIMTPDMHEVEGQVIPKGEIGSYDLASLFTEVSHAVGNDIQLGAGIASSFNQADLPIQCCPSSAAHTVLTETPQCMEEYWGAKILLV